MTDTTSPKSKDLKKERIPLDNPDAFMRALAQYESQNPKSDTKEED